jgi:hypothetical protein
MPDLHPDRFRIEQQRVVTPTTEYDDVATREDRALAGDDHRIGIGDHGHVRDVMLVRPSAEA